jgi:SAM-dependent methyltransferase
VANGPPRIFDRRSYRLHRARTSRAEEDQFLVEAAAEHLAERIQAVNRRFRNALDLGSRPRAFTRLSSHAESWTRAALAAQPGAASLVVDEELLPFARESFDLVTSVLSLHAVNDLPGALLQIRQALKADGLFMAAIFGGETLSELRQSLATAEAEISGGISPRVAPFADVRDLGALLQRAGFALPVTDLERTTVRYRDLPKLFADLRAMGETNALAERRSSFSSRRLLAATLEAYARRFADADGRLRVTFDIIYLTAWAPHESQQQPLKPGSANARLADALGTKEIPAGERAVPRADPAAKG